MKQHIEGPEISAFLDGALAAPDRVRVEGHLSSCSDCRAELDSLRHLKLTLSSAARRVMPADLALAIERRLVRAESWWSPLMRPTLWVPAGAVATAALLVGLWIHSTGTAEEVPLEPLLAAHSRYSAETLVPEENLVASNYSEQFTSLYADSSDTELE